MTIITHPNNVKCWADVPPSCVCRDADGVLWIFDADGRTYECDSLYDRRQTDADGLAYRTRAVMNFIDPARRRQREDLHVDSHPVTDVCSYGGDGENVRAVLAELGLSRTFETVYYSLPCGALCRDAEGQWWINTFDGDGAEDLVTVAYGASPGGASYMRGQVDRPTDPIQVATFLAIDEMTPERFAAEIAAYEAEHGKVECRRPITRWGDVPCGAMCRDIDGLLWARRADGHAVRIDTFDNTPDPTHQLALQYATSVLVPMHRRPWLRAHRAEHPVTDVCKVDGDDKALAEAVFAAHGGSFPVKYDQGGGTPSPVMMRMDDGTWIVSGASVSDPDQRIDIDSRGQVKLCVIDSDAWFDKPATVVAMLGPDDYTPERLAAIIAATAAPPVVASRVATASSCLAP